MRKWKKYPKYKDSGVEWLGEIPETWKSVTIRHISNVKRGASPRPIDDPKYFDDDGEYAWVRISDVSASSRYLEHTTQKLSNIGQKCSVCLEPGEIFLSMAGSIGKVIITKIKCCIHDGFVYFVNLKENRDFLYYIFQCNQMYIGLGKLGTQLNLNTDTIGDIKISLPSLPEQTAIASFLDRETARIDILIEKKQRQIELLQEKRAALISQAVTKGLDPTVPMKDSGVPWLGEVPEHWEITRLKYIINVVGRIGFRGYTTDDQVPEGEGAIVLGATQINNEGYIDYSDLTFISWDKYYESPEIIVNRFDIILVQRGSTCGKVGYIEHLISSTTINPSVVLLKNSQIISKYVFFLLGSQGIQNYYKSLLASTAIPMLSQFQISNTTIVLPSCNEIEKIIEYIDSNLKIIKKISDKLHSSIELLKEYRSSLISHTVTGKIKV